MPNEVLCAAAIRAQECQLRHNIYRYEAHQAQVDAVRLFQKKMAAQQAANQQSAQEAAQQPPPANAPPTE